MGCEDALLRFTSGRQTRNGESARPRSFMSRWGHLYDSLPLVKFDADARRFWRRVFGLVRIPGGRYLLKFLSALGGKPARLR